MVIILPIQLFLNLEWVDKLDREQDRYFDDLDLLECFDLDFPWVMSGSYNIITREKG